jgi:hypothetical protein
MAFPTLGILDDFNRDENPLGNGNWSGPAVGLSNHLRTFVATIAMAQAGGVGASYWSASQFGPDIEIYATVSGGQNQLAFVWRTSSPGLSSYSGYQASVVHSASVVRIYKVVNGTPSQLGADISVSFADGDSVGIEHVGATITLYKKTGGTWSSVDTRSNNDISGAGYFVV